MSELALLGGTPAVPNLSKHYEWPPITRATEEAVLQQLRTSISIYNKSGVIDTLEQNLCAYHESKRALLTCTGTAALHLAYISAGLTTGDEVLVPSYTFYATATPLFFTGAIPILVEMGANGNIDPQAILKKITPKTKAIVITHMWGIPCDMDFICAIAREHRLLLIEDGSHAHGATYREKKVGTFGDIAVFSLQGQKTLTGGEGGFLLTDNDEFYYRAVLAGHYNKRCLQEIPKKHPLYCYGVTGMGLKLRIHPLAAAIANEQLSSLDLILEKRRSIAKRMLRFFSSFDGVQIPIVSEDEAPSWYALVLQIDLSKLPGLTMKKLFDALQAEGAKEFDLPTSTSPLNLLPLFQDPAPLFPQYTGKIAYHPGDFPKAEKFYTQALKIPVWHSEEGEKVWNYYATAFEKVITHYKEFI